jgi:hypothetical protein
MRIRCFVVGLSLAALIGCGTEIPPEPPGSSSPPAPVADTAPAAALTPDAAASAEPAAMPADSAAVPAVPLPQPPATEPAIEMELTPPAQAPSPAPPAAEIPADMERVKAEKGVGIKGRSLDEHQGMLVTPAKAYFSVRERVVFEIQIPEAVKLFKATNGNGPKSHDEFMAQIIDANQIQLPELPAGQRYVYDPEKEELMVERPRQ